MLEAKQFIERLHSYYEQSYETHEMDYDTNGIGKDLYQYLNKQMDSTRASEFKDILGDVLNNVSCDICWDYITDNIVNTRDSWMSFSVYDESVAFSEDNHYSMHLIGAIVHHETGTTFNYSCPASLQLTELFNENYVDGFIDHHIRYAYGNILNFKSQNPDQPIFK